MRNQTKLKLRRKVHLKERKRCYLCGSRIELSELTIDHFIPRMEGGSNRLGNLKGCCLACNSIKGRCENILRNQEQVLTSGQIRTIVLAYSYFLSILVKTKSKPKDGYVERR